MTIWIVSVDWDYGAYEVLAAFSLEESAQRFVEARPELQLTINCLELDEEE